MEQERRRVPRFRLIAPAELVDETSGTRITAYVTDLSLYGCTLGVTHPPRPGMTIRLEIVTPGESFESQATVVYSQVHSVGLTFRDVKPHALTVLHSWLVTAMQESQKAGGSS
jgi:hypothetical protein